MFGGFINFRDVVHESSRERGNAKLEEERGWWYLWGRRTESSIKNKIKTYLVSMYVDV